MDLRRIPFKKMNGLGNDFVVIDARAGAIELSPSLAGRIASRTDGAGCDQVIILEPSSVAEVFMRIFNADGSEAGACGNATRCIATILQPAVGRDRMTIETRAGLLDAVVAGDGLVTVDMGVPGFAWNEIPLARPFANTSAIDLTHALPDGRVLSGPSTVNVGNPHCIFWVSDAGSYDLASFGPELEHHSLFPERANISLAEVLETPSPQPSPRGEMDRMRGDLPSRIKLRVWERGAGITRACGTAACATAVAAARLGKTGRHVEVELPAGSLTIEWRADNHILMTGPTEFEFDGIVSLEGGRLSVEVTRHS
jgi:diaminopimelate epimerase